jgi:hypothetical protein
VGTRVEWRVELGGMIASLDLENGRTHWRQQFATAASAESRETRAARPRDACGARELSKRREGDDYDDAAGPRARRSRCFEPLGNPDPR